MPIIAIQTDIFVEVAAGAEETACFELEDGLPHRLHGFPFGEVITARVEGYRTLSDDEIRERGFDDG